MSTLQNPENIISLSSFNADMVASHYGVAIDGGTSHMAMRFMFRMMKEELNIKGKTNLVQNKNIAGLAIDEMAFRYNAFLQYSDNYFGHHFFYEANIDAVALAVICGKYVSNLNERITSEETAADIEFVNDGIPQELCLQAANMAEDAAALIDYGIKKETCSNIEPEVIFLLHIFALEHFNNIENAPDDFSLQQKKAVLDGAIPVVSSYIDQRLQLGRDMKSYVPYMEEKLKPFLPEAKKNIPPPALKNRPQLVLIKPPQP